MTAARGILRPWVGAVAVLLASAGAGAQELRVAGDGSVEIRELRVSASVEGRVARTTVEEVFFNPLDREAEGEWLLALPEGAAVERFSMWVDGVETAGELLDSRRARGIYESIVRSRRDPGLLEMAGNRLFRARVFPIPARGEKRVKLSFTELLPGGAGSATWRFPLRMAGGKVVGAASVVVEVATERPLSSAYSPTHRVDVLRRDDRHARVAWEATRFEADRDFVLVLQEPAGDLGFSFLASRPPAEDGTFLLVLSPGVDPAERPLPRDVVIGLDTSGSMAGEKIEQAKAALRHAVLTLSPEDRFSLVTFATEPRRFREELVTATPEAVAAALAFIGEIDASGGTAIAPALESGLDLLVRAEGDRPAVLLFLTDGLPTVGVSDPAAILAMAKEWAPARARVFTFGVGHDVNTVLLDRLAADLRGARDYVAPKEDIEVKVSALVDKTRYPVFAAPRLEVEGVRVSAVYPRVLPDLFRGSELVVAGRYEGSGPGVVRVRGTATGGERVFEREVAFPEHAPDAAFVDRLWAVRRVGHLLDEMRLHGKSDEQRDEVVRLSRRHGIVTPYTSYLVVEDEAMLNESASLGDPRFDADAPFRGQGTHAEIGVGGAAGGAFGGRTGGHRNLRAEGGGGTEGATEAGLEWLRRRQDPAGHWEFSAGATGLSLLAFLGYGETHKTPRYGHTVRAGLKFLKGVQDSRGCFGSPADPGSPLDHAQATLAMAEAYGLTQSPLYQTSAQNGIDYLFGLHEPRGGWGAGTGDIVATAWAVMALKSGQGAGLRVDPVALDEAAGWMRSRLAAAEASGEPIEAGTRAAVLLSRILAGATPDDPSIVAESAALLAAVPAEKDTEGWHFGTLAQFQIGGDHWRRWNDAMKAAVIDSQRSDRTDPATWGSWDPEDPNADRARLRDTASNTMCLEVYYRYARVFGTRTHRPPTRPAAGPSGREAVEASLEAKRLAEAETAGEAAGEHPAGTVRELAGRRFTLRDGAWWEDGVEADAPRRTVAPYSEEWFDLARADPVLERCFTLGRVVLRHGTEVIEVGR